MEKGSNGSGARAIQKSADRKLTTDPKGRPVSATYVSQGSCPLSCAFHPEGDNPGACYANGGHTSITTRRMNASATVKPHELAKAEAAEIDALKASGQPLRLHVVGDCRTDASARTVSAAADRFESRGGGRAYTYTHAWRSVAPVSWGGVSVLASVESVADAARASAKGYASAMVVPDAHPSQRAHPIGRGLTGVPCPQQTGRARDCERCRLCFDSDGLHARGQVILFAAHGSVKKVRAAIG